MWWLPKALPTGAVSSRGLLFFFRAIYFSLTNQNRCSFARVIVHSVSIIHCKSRSDEIAFLYRGSKDVSDSFLDLSGNMWSVFDHGRPRPEMLINLWNSILKILFEIHLDGLKYQITIWFFKINRKSIKYLKKIFDFSKINTIEAEVACRILNMRLNIIFQ